jgi:hypothetical protein
MIIPKIVGGLPYLLLGKVGTITIMLSNILLVMVYNGGKSILPG